MPKQTPSASDYTKTVGGAAQVNASVANTSAGIFAKRTSGSVPLAGSALSAIRAAVTQSAVAKSSGLQPLSLRVTTVTPTPAIIQNLTLANAGGVDGFIARYNSSGSIVWVARLSGTDSDFIRAVFTDSTGLTYVGCGYNASVTLYNADGTSFNTYSTAGSYDALNVVFDNSGKVVRAMRVGSTQEDQSYAITADSSGNILAGGTIRGASTARFYNANGTVFSTTSFNSDNTNDSFVVKYNPTGTVSHVIRILGPQLSFSDTTTSIVTLPNNSYLVYGDSAAQYNIKDSTGTNNFWGSSAQQGVFFLANMTSDGLISWVAQIAMFAGSSSTNFQTYSPRRIVVDSDSSSTTGGIYIGGSVRSGSATVMTVYNSATTANNFTTLGWMNFPGSSNAYGFVVKMNKSGNGVWAARILANAADCAVRDTGVDSDKNVYVCGNYGGTLTFYNALVTSSLSSDISTATTTFGTTLSVATATDMFLAKYNANGTVAWVTRITGGGDTDNTNAITVTSAGDIFVAGTTNSTTLTFYNSTNPATSIGGTFTGSAGGDAFIAKYNTSGVFQWSRKIASSGADSIESIHINADGSMTVGGYYMTGTLTLN